jgi:hypothetical protein
VEWRRARDAGSNACAAAIERAETKTTDNLLAPFARRGDREGKRRRFDEADRRVPTGDGAPWLRNIVAECCRGTIDILDKYHANEHIHDVARALFGAGTDLCRA